LPADGPRRRGARATGAQLAFEVGPGRVLTGLAKRIVPGLKGLPAGDVESIRRAHEALAA
jgi:malonyl CoA-acyl carrier protein transacylase